MAQINEVTAALRAATLAAMLEPARPRPAEPGQAMVVLDQRAYELKAAGDDDVPSMCCFSVETSLSTSPLRTVELFQAG